MPPSAALVVGDLPFGSYEESSTQALRASSRFLKETQCQAVKLEGGRRVAATIGELVEAGIPVMGHVGLTPQSVRKLGGYKVQRDAEFLLDEARAVADAGAFAVVLECVPAAVATRITQSLSIPTIGIGAGPGCDGQVLVTPDLLGLFEGFRPKFVRHYAELGDAVRQAAKRYIEDVAEGRLPQRSRELSLMSTFATTEQLLRARVKPVKGECRRSRRKKPRRGWAAYRVGACRRRDHGFDATGSCVTSRRASIS